MGEVGILPFDGLEKRHKSDGREKAPDARAANLEE
jgi:hypothetical protein